MLTRMNLRNLKTLTTFSFYKLYAGIFSEKNARFFFFAIFIYFVCVREREKAGPSGFYFNALSCTTPLLLLENVLSAGAKKM